MNFMEQARAAMTSDPKLLFSVLALRPGSTFLDLGCGRGDYAIAASELIGGSGHVYAVDAWEEGIEQLKSALKDRGIRHVSPILADIGQRLPLEDRSIDVCLAATVFHDLVQENVHHQALLEVKRTLKEDGTLAVVEFKKFAGRPGPAIEVKSSRRSSRRSSPRMASSAGCARRSGPTII
ncbi:MAG: methyltransferase domain-containing protein [Desulfobacterales bacterium]|nr:methyltransferase domain-containing protein [Desulfobacterales bacterium]